MTTGQKRTRFLKFDVGFKYTVPEPVVNVITSKTTKKEKYFDWFFNQLAADADTLCRLAAADLVEVVVADDKYQREIFQLLKLDGKQRNKMLVRVAAKINEDVEGFFHYMLSGLEDPPVKEYNPQWVPKGRKHGPFWKKAKDEFFTRLCKLFEFVEITEVKLIDDTNRAANSNR